ncbi:putative membrane protein [Streptococcus uberis 0140J]|uniref:Membrane protein n=1 Tax=Streptococcus uberis (strain ATCC BAA-854 / 0140J) TaxID=218495 RepID=B9DT88_STRU0|nr:putative membrane protein [Streptococcus uberis 0140J]
MKALSTVSFAYNENLITLLDIAFFLYLATTYRPFRGNAI